jgi:hypothetical protein
MTTFETIKCSGVLLFVIVLYATLTLIYLKLPPHPDPYHYSHLRTELNRNFPYYKCDGDTCSRCHPSDPNEFNRKPYMYHIKYGTKPCKDCHTSLRKGGKSDPALWGNSEGCKCCHVEGGDIHLKLYRDCGLCHPKYFNNHNELEPCMH